MHLLLRCISQILKDGTGDLLHSHYFQKSRIEGCPAFERHAAVHLLMQRVVLCQEPVTLERQVQVYRVQRYLRNYQIEHSLRYLILAYGEACAHHC